MRLDLHEDIAPGDIHRLNYGRDSYEFVKDKPLTLINGANLLHLLSKHGYQLNIDLTAAKRMLREQASRAG